MREIYSNRASVAVRLCSPWLLAILCAAAFWPGAVAQAEDCTPASAEEALETVDDMLGMLQAAKCKYRRSEDLYDIHFQLRQAQCKWRRLKSCHEKAAKNLAALESELAKLEVLSKKEKLNRCDCARLRELRTTVPGKRRCCRTQKGWLEYHCCTLDKFHKQLGEYAVEWSSARNSARGAAILKELNDKAADLKKACTYAARECKN